MGLTLYIRGMKSLLNYFLNFSNWIRPDGRDGRDGIYDLVGVRIMKIVNRLYDNVY